MDEIIKDELSSLVETLMEVKGTPIETANLFNIPGQSETHTL